MSYPIDISLNRYFTTDSHKIAKREKFAGDLYTLAAAVAFVAVIALAAVITFATLQLIAPLSPGLFPVLIVLEAFLYKALLYCCSSASEAYEGMRAQTEREQTIEKMKRELSFDDIKAFFKEHGLSEPEQPSDLTGHFRAISFFNYAADTATKAFREYEKTFSDPRLINTGKRREAWEKLEKLALRSALEAALILQCIQKPTLQIKLEDLGEVHNMAFDERAWSSQNEYFVFKDRRQPSLSFPEAMRCLAEGRIDTLREILFQETKAERPRSSSFPFNRTAEHPQLFFLHLLTH